MHKITVTNVPILLRKNCERRSTLPTLPNTLVCVFRYWYCKWAKSHHSVTNRNNNRFYTRDKHIKYGLLSKWLLLSANPAIYQLYHDENKLIVNENEDEVRFLLGQHAYFDFYSASSLKQQSADRHVAALGHIILISSQPVIALSP